LARYSECHNKLVGRFEASLAFTVGELVMALTAAVLASRALPAIALCCISANAFAQAPGETRAPVAAVGEASGSVRHLGCDRLCWQPDPYHPVGLFTCYSKLSTPPATDGYTQAVYSKDIAVGKSMLLSSGPVTSGVTCGNRTDIPVWGYVRAREIVDLTQPPVTLNQVVKVTVTGVDYNQKDSLFFPDPNAKGAINPSADADNK
jgi:hypothetical protein